MGKILVIGSSNTDLIARIKCFPAAGETIEGTSFHQAMGGKGANQAMAAHRLGGDVEFITCLGNDPNGQTTLKYYEKEGLDISSSLVIKNVSSGTAMILVDDNGENCIVITPGANKLLSSEYIVTMEEAIIRADIVMLQMEIPYETVKMACQLAYKNKKKILLNVAPAYQVDPEVIKIVDILVVNEIEAEKITEEKITLIGEDAIVDTLLSMGAKTVILTLGKNGCIMKNNEMHITFPAFTVDARDTTGAGDTFCGALTAELSKGRSWHSALKFATAAAAICVTRMGAQPSIPNEKEVRKFLSENIELEVK